VIILDLATGQRTNLDAGIADAHEVAVSPDGRYGVAADFGDYKGDYKFDGHRLAVFDLKEKRLARVIDLGAYLGPHDVTFISPTRLVVTTQTTQHVVEVDVVEGRVLGATETRAKGSHTLAVSADGRTAFTANEPEGTLSRLDLAKRAFVAKHSVSRSTAEGVATTPDGREVWMGFQDDGAVRVIDGQNGNILATLNGFLLPQRMTISRDGKRAVITDFNCEVVQVADVATRRLIGPIAGLEGAGVAKVLPDSRVAIVLLLDERVLVMADLHTRRVIARHALGGPRPDAAAWGPTPR
jgi:DNA-binding beta-propeller fold protein YncE